MSWGFHRRAGSTAIALASFLFIVAFPAPPLAQTSTKQSTQIKRPTGKWKVTKKRSPMDDSSTVVLSLPAENIIQGWLRRERPTLMIRCQEGDTDVFIHAGTPADVENADDRYTVEVRVDKYRSFKDSWLGSTSRDALFAPGAALYAATFAHAESLTIRFTPFNAAPVVIKFDTRGLKGYLRSVAEPCGWGDFWASLRGTGERRRVVEVADDYRLTLDEDQGVSLAGVEVPSSRNLARTNCLRLLQDLVSEKQVLVKKAHPDPDYYGLGYVYLPDGLFVNTELVKRGCATAESQADHVFYPQFLTYQAQAEKARVGIWETSEEK